MSSTKETKNGAIIFTDIVGSSKLWNKFPHQMHSALRTHNNRILKIVKKNKGIVVKTMGDAFMIYCKFKTGYKIALVIAMKIQNSLINDPIRLGNNDSIKLRIGIAQGPLTVQKVSIQGRKMKDYFGTTVNLASRMESKVAVPNGISFCFFDVDIPEEFIMKLAKDYRLTIGDYTGFCRYNQTDSYRCLDPELLKGVPGIITFSLFL